MRARIIELYVFQGHLYVVENIGTSDLAFVWRREVVMGPELMVPCPSCGRKAGLRCRVEPKHDDGKIVHIARARKYALWKSQLFHGNRSRPRRVV